MSPAARAALRPEDRLIVALDVPTAEDAQRFVDELEGLVTFYKVGLELMMTGSMETLLQRLLVGKKVFVDLKLPNDIPETVKRAVDVAAGLGVTFLTLSNAVTPVTIQSAVAGRGNRPLPELLFVPLLSSMDRADFAETTTGVPLPFEEALKRRTDMASKSGSDGFIVSGREIGLVRGWYPNAVLVSPGIRPAGSTADDHKRSCTPAEAIQLGADHIVVGRPIRNAPKRRDAAKRILDEIAAATNGA